jgi:hypothetical protein
MPRIHHPGVPGQPSISVAEELSASESFVDDIEFSIDRVNLTILDHARLATNQRRHSEPRLRFCFLGLDGGPATVHTPPCSPVEMIEVSSRINQVIKSLQFCSVWVSMR